jgi:hypothetical protein
MWLYQTGHQLQETHMNQYTVEFLQALANVLAPTARVRHHLGSMQMYVEGRNIGYLDLDSSDRWYATRFEMSLCSNRKQLQGTEEQYGPFATPAQAIRRLFCVDNAPQVRVKEGVSADRQTETHKRVLLQSVGREIAFSIATRLDVPKYFQSQGENATAHYIADMLEKASAVVPGLSFDIKIGPSA